MGRKGRGREGREGKGKGKGRRGDGEGEKRGGAGKGRKGRGEGKGHSNPLKKVWLRGCSLLTYIHYNSNMGAGTDGYCFSGSPSLTCISLKFDLYVYL